MCLKGVRISILGGDEREKELIRTFLFLEADVTVVGDPFGEPISALHVVDSLEAAVQNAQVVVAPMTGADENGVLKKTFVAFPLILSPDLLEKIPTEALFLIGMAGKALKRFVKNCHFTLLETAKMDEIAIRNAIPTAEGAVQIVLERLPITIHGAEVLILGFGRVGFALARLLQGMGANVTIAARSEVQLVEAETCRLRHFSLANLAEKIAPYQIVLNTIPALVLERHSLENMLPDVLVVDLASSPGGTDFVAARELGRQAILALGLPGKVAPKTAGKILGDVLPGVIQNYLNL